MCAFEDSPQRRNEHFHIAADVLDEKNVHPNGQCAHLCWKKFHDDSDANADERLSEDVIADQRDKAVRRLEKHDAGWKERQEQEGLSMLGANGRHNSISVGHR